MHNSSSIKRQLNVQLANVIIFPAKEHQMAPYNIEKKNENEDGAFLMNFREKGSFYRLIL